MKSKSRPSPDYDIQLALPELKATSSSKSLKSIEEFKANNEAYIEFEETVYKTPTMKPKHSERKRGQCSTQTDKFKSTPGIIDYYDNIASEQEKARFFQEYELLEVKHINIY